MQKDWSLDNKKKTMNFNKIGFLWAISLRRVDFTNKYDVMIIVRRKSLCLESFLNFKEILPNFPTSKNSHQNFPFNFKPHKPKNKKGASKTFKKLFREK